MAQWLKHLPQKFRSYAGTHRTHIQPDVVVCVHNPRTPKKEAEAKKLPEAHGTANLVYAAITRDCTSGKVKGED